MTADGSIQEGIAIILREVQIGNKVINNVQASVVHNLKCSFPAWTISTRKIRQDVY
jgi:predicted aspartyl protease